MLSSSTSSPAIVYTSSSSPSASSVTCLTMRPTTGRIVTANNAFILNKLNSNSISCRNSCVSNLRSSIFGKALILNKRKLFSFPFNSKPFSIVMEWQESTVKIQVDVPVSVAYDCYSDREAIPRWMTFISSVKIMEDKPDLSKWSLKYKVFGQDLEYSWIARNMQPIPNQKIHWRSLEGLPNSGAVRFYPKGPSSCLVELTVSFEVPQLLVPVASKLNPGNAPSEMAINVVVSSLKSIPLHVVSATKPYDGKGRGKRIICMKK